MILKEADSRSLLDLAIVASHDAGSLVRQISGSDLSASTKSSPTDIVTQMDGASEKLIRQIILAARPDDGIIGEEGTSLRSRSGVSWLVDPIDGTTNYLRGIPNYSISIAAMEDDKTLAGVVYDPTLEETFTAISGKGAALNGTRIDCSRTVIKESIIGTGFSYSSIKRARQAEILRTILPCVGEFGAPVRRPSPCAGWRAGVWMRSMKRGFSRGTTLRERSSPARLARMSWALGKIPRRIDSSSPPRPV